jgi:hypothetical protein
MEVGPAIQITIHVNEYANSRSDSLHSEILTFLRPHGASGARILLVLRMETLTNWWTFFEKLDSVSGRQFWPKEVSRDQPNHARRPCLDQMRTRVNVREGPHQADLTGCPKRSHTTRLRARTIPLADEGHR